MKLTGPTTGYMTYALPNKINVARLTRDPQGTNWTAETILRLDDIPYRNDVPIVSDFDLSNAYKSWRDAYPFSFDVGNINYATGAGHLYLAMRQTTTPVGVSQVLLWDCIDGGPTAPTCSVERTGWRRRYFGLTSPAFVPEGEKFTGQFQPVVAASRIGADAAVAWYQNIGSYGAFRRQMMTVYARRSTNDGDVFDPPRAIDPARWSACPAKSTANNYYGDYVGMVFPTRLNAEQPLSTITVYTSSTGGCIDQSVSASVDATTFDQHVASATW